MTRQRQFVMVVAVIAAGAASAFGDIINGGFEAPANPPAAGNYVDIGPGQEEASGFCGWTVESGTVDVVDGSAPLFGIDWGAQASIDGAQVLDLNGFSDGTISQVFFNAPDSSHTLTFWYTNNPLDSAAETALVTVTDAVSGTVWLSKSITHSNATLTEPNWVQFSQNFVAVGTRTRVRLTSTTPGGGASDGIILDAVSISDVSAADHVLGDMNCDGLVGAADVPLFIEALLDPAAYSAANVCCHVLNADVNGDGSVDGRDIQPFTVCEMGGACP